MQEWVVFESKRNWEIFHWPYLAVLPNFPSGFAHFWAKWQFRFNGLVMFGLFRLLVGSWRCWLGWISAFRAMVQAQAVFPPFPWPTTQKDQEMMSRIVMRSDLAIFFHFPLNSCGWGCGMKFGTESDQSHLELNADSWPDFSHKMGRIWQPIKVWSW